MWWILEASAVKANYSEKRGWVWSIGKESCLQISWPFSVCDLRKRWGRSGLSWLSAWKLPKIWPCFSSSTPTPSGPRRGLLTSHSWLIDRGRSIWGWSEACLGHLDMVGVREQSWASMSVGRDLRGHEVNPLTLCYSRWYAVPNTLAPIPSESSGWWQWC